MEYAPPVNCTVCTAPASVTSSIPAVMVPLPSAVKLPTLAINAPGCALASVPLIEKEYVPCRFAFVKFPMAGGGVGLDDPLPPHETVSTARAPAATTSSRLTAHPSH